MREGNAISIEPPLDIPLFDDRAMRRAVRRGLLRTALVTTAVLTALLMLVSATSAAVSMVRGGSFFRVAYNGTRMAHPEYEIKQEGSCCSTGPLFGLTNLGLNSALTVQIRPTGALHYAGATMVVVEQDLAGDIHSSIDSAGTPLGDALHRGRPTREAAETYLRKLPEPMVVSALIEFDHPLDEAAFHTFVDRYLPVFDVPNRGVPLFLTSPYTSSTTNPVSWPTTDFSELRSWASELSASDDEQLARIGLPTAADIKQATTAGMIHAFVVPRMPLSLARTLLGAPSVHSINVLDAAFSPGLRE